MNEKSKRGSAGRTTDTLGELARQLGVPALGGEDTPSGVRPLAEFDAQRDFRAVFQAAKDESGAGDDGS